MTHYNLKKSAAKVPQILDKELKDNRQKMEMCTDAQGVVDKNINLSLPTKDKDNTVPFNKQLDAARKDSKEDPQITEASMDKKEVSFGEKTNGVSAINAMSQKLDDEKAKAFKKAEDAVKKETLFWDKYVGVQMETPVTKVPKNIPAAASQLPNNPERFKGEEVDKMVMASLRDADAMLFHIYATAGKEGRSLTKEEEQQIVDINSGKMRVLAQFQSEKKNSLGDDPTIKLDRDGKARVYETDGTCIDEFKDCKEAQSNYPEGKIITAQISPVPSPAPLQDEPEEEPMTTAPKQIRYRATFPIDVWIDDTGDEEQNTNTAYEMITEGLQRGELPNYQLYASDIVRYDRLLQ
jgi:hypothetical protein